MNFSVTVTTAEDSSPRFDFEFSSPVRERRQSESLPSPGVSDVSGVSVNFLELKLKGNGYTLGEATLSKLILSAFRKECTQKEINCPLWVEIRNGSLLGAN